jgi:hypothetical protein
MTQKKPKSKKIAPFLFYLFLLGLPFLIRMTWSAYKRIIQNFYSPSFRKSFLRISLPIILFILGFGLLFINSLNRGDNLGALIQSKKSTSFPFWEKEKPLSGKKITGRFKAMDKNLGTISLRFRSEGAAGDDALIFRIKAKDQKDWHYQNRYATDQFLSDQLFPFGFPKIKDSKGKIFLFEIESLPGENGDTVSLSQTEPVFQAKYQFGETELWQDKFELFRFPLKKLVNVITSRALEASFFIYFSPLIFYFFFLLFAQKFFSKNPLSASVFLLVLLDVFFSHQLTSLAFLTLILAWLWLSKFRQSKILVALAGGAIFVLAPSLLLLLKEWAMIKKLANWSVLLLLVGLVIDLGHLLQKSKSQELKKTLSECRLSLSILLLISLEVFFIGRSSDFFVLSIIAIWFFVERGSRLKVKLSLWAGLVFLSLCPLFLSFGRESAAKVSAVWAFCFFSIGLAQTLWQTLETNKQKRIKQKLDLFKKKYLAYFPLATTSFALIFLQSLFFDHNQWIVIVLAALWFLSSLIYRLSGRISIIAGLFFLASYPIFFLFSQEALVDRLATWAFIFLTIGVVQLLFQSRKEEKKN